MYWSGGIFRTGVHRIILKDNRCEKYRAREVEYEDQTVYCRCQYPDGGIFVYADHLCSCTGRNTSDRGYGSCVKGARAALCHVCWVQIRRDHPAITITAKHIFSCGVRHKKNHLFSFTHTLTSSFLFAALLSPLYHTTFSVQKMPAHVHDFFCYPHFL